MSNSESINSNCLDCLFCAATVLDHSSLPAMKTEVLIDSIIKFLYFNKLGTFSVQPNYSFSNSNHSQLLEEYYRSIFQDPSTFYCHPCTEKIENIIKTLQQLEELEAHLNTLQHEILGQLRVSLCSQSKFNQYRRHITIRLEASLGLSTEVAVPSKFESEFNYEDSLVEEKKLIPDIELVTTIDHAKAYVKLIRLEESNLESQCYIQQLIKKSKRKAKLSGVRSNLKRQAKSTPDPISESGDNESNMDNLSPEHDCTNSGDNEEDYNFEIAEENFNPPKETRRLTAKTIRMNYSAIKVAKGQSNVQFFDLKCQYPACTVREATVILLKEHVQKSHLSCSASTNANCFCEYCGKDFSDNLTELEKHTSEHGRHIGRHEYSCKFCSTTCVFSASIYSHFRRWHRELYEQNERSKLKPNSELFYQCKYCKCLCINLIDLWKHVRNKHIKPKTTVLYYGNIEKVMYECKFCPKSYHTARAARKHETLAHKDEVIRISSFTVGDEPIESKSSDSEIIIKEENLSSNENKITDSAEFYFERTSDDYENSSKTSRTTAEEKEGNQSFSDAQLTKLIMEEQTFYCQYTNCQFTSTDINIFEAHVKDEHLKCTDDESNSICNKCGLEFGIIIAEGDIKTLIEGHMLYKHSESSNQPLRLNCKFCARSFVRPGQLHRHFRGGHSKLYQDLLSGKDINPDLQTSATNEGDDDDPKFECKFCPLSFSSKYLFAHIRNRHEHHVFRTSVNPIDRTKTYKCNFCSFTTVILKSIWKHYRNQHTKFFESTDSIMLPSPASLTHTKTPEVVSDSLEPQQYICEICGSKFERKIPFTNHIRSHNRAYRCTLCRKGFYTQELLEKHQSNTHAKQLGLPLFKCEQCGRLLANAETLKGHIRSIHNKEFAFSCEFCPYKCKHKCKLKIHMLCHSDERPLKCHLCPATFKLQFKLNVHLKGHTGEKQYVCKYCGKGFNRLDHWKRHEATHEPARPFPCLLCGVKFPTSHNRRAHVRSHHKNKGIGAGIKPTRKSKYNRPDDEDNQETETIENNQRLDLDHSRSTNVDIGFNFAQQHQQ